MSETLSCNLSANLQAALALAADAVNAQTATFAAAPLLNLALTTGKGLNQVNQAIAFQRILASGGSALDSISMYNFAITNTGGTTGSVATAVDGCGQSLVLAAVKVLIIQNLGAAADLLEVGGDNTTAAWLGWFKDKTDIVRIRGGGSLIVTAPDASGMAVTNTTNHLLRIASVVGGAAVTYNFWAFGATA